MDDKIKREKKYNKNIMVCCPACIKTAEWGFQYPEGCCCWHMEKIPSHSLDCKICDDKVKKDLLNEN